MNGIDFNHFNDCYSEASTDELSNFIILVADACDRESVNLLKAVWLSHIHDDMVINGYFNRYIMAGTGFPLEHNILNKKISMYFCIGSLIHKYESGKIHYQKMMFSDIKELVYYTEMGSDHLDEHYMDTPILAVQMPVMDDTMIRQFAVVDGNHRMSAAKRLGLNIEITVIADNFLPPDVFMNNTSWILYNFLIGLYSLQLGLVRDDLYLSSLNGILDTFII